MLTNETTKKLQEMHLGVMARAFATQLSDTQASALFLLKTALPYWWMQNGLPGKATISSDS